MAKGLQDFLAVAKVKSMAGGFTGWQQEGHKVVSAK